MDNPLLRIISSKNKAQLHFFDKGTPRSGLSRSYNGYFCQNMSGMMTWETYSMNWTKAWNAMKHATIHENLNCYSSK